MKFVPKFLVVALLAVVFLFTRHAFALNEGNPYVSIAGRNVFALKPPSLPSPANTQPVTPPAGIELQGFTTILGRPQVLLKVKIPPKPPEPAKDRSLVMDIGQREGDVEVLEMDTRAGVVKLKNQGNSISLNLKENAAKPAAGPALAAPAMLPPPGAIPPPATSALPSASPGGASVSPFGGSSSTPNANPRANLPTRSIRSTGANTGANVQGGQGEPNDNLSVEARFALIEIERERTKAAVDAGRLPPLPPMNIPDK
jgi:hypothetical protein